MTNPAWDLFDPPPDIRVVPPSAPGSKTSEDAADAIAPFRRKSWRRILYTLAALNPDKVLSREEIAGRTGMKEASLCARLSELAPTWVQVVEGACFSSSRKTVNGYRITPAGRALFNQTGGAAA